MESQGRSEEKIGKNSEEEKLVDKTVYQANPVKMETAEDNKRNMVRRW